MQTSTLLGTAGVTLLLLAFFANLAGFQKQNGWIYLILNASGAALACYSSLLIDFMPFVVLEGTWALVAMIAIVKKML